jgi:hypothetical protein
MREPPSAERQRHLTLLAFEAWLSRASLNGTPPSDDVLWLVAEAAAAAPRTAVRCPNVRRVLPPDIRAAVAELAAQPPQRAAPGVTRGVTEIAAPPLSQAGSGPGYEPGVSPRLTVEAAARRLGVENQSVRAACRRGSLPARKGDDGRWLIKTADLTEYRRSHGKERAGG